ncbi:MAG: hypothetical protein WD669_04930 [Pirellulales bacterium]
MEFEGNMDKKGGSEQHEADESRRLGRPLDERLVGATDPFDDFDDDDFDDEFDDDFEEEWDEELPGDADLFPADDVEEKEDDFDTPELEDEE